MKKTMKKLELNRETLAGLENGLENVAGGFTQLNHGCFSGKLTCDSCVLTCYTTVC